MISSLYNHCSVFFHSLKRPLFFPLDHSKMSNTGAVQWEHSCGLLQLERSSVGHATGCSWEWSPTARLVPTIISTLTNVPYEYPRDDNWRRRVTEEVRWWTTALRSSQPQHTLSDTSHVSVAATTATTSEAGSGKSNGVERDRGTRLRQLPAPLPSAARRSHHPAAVVAVLVSRLQPRLGVVPLEICQLLRVDCTATFPADINVQTARLLVSCCCYT